MRFFADKQQIEAGTLANEDVKHLKDVMRAKVGEKFTLCDGEQNDYICEITTLEKNSVSYDILEQYKNENEPSVKITLFQGLPKSHKMELIIQKAVEIGITEIVLVETTRSVVKIKGEEKKLERWQKISRSAAMQSRRGIIPAVRYAKFSELKKATAGFDLNLIAYENEREQTLKRVLQSEHMKPTSIAIYIGPEGGFTEEEVEAITDKGHSVSLGKRILRTETAALVMASQLLYELE